MILDIFLLISIVACPCMSFLLLKRVNKIERSIEQNEIVSRHRDETIAQVRVSLEQVKEFLDTQKPIISEGKPNNWDSVKEAFKGPTRAIEVNERNRTK